jgi:hypothetical protein
LEHRIKACFNALGTEAGEKEVLKCSRIKLIDLIVSEQVVQGVISYLPERFGFGARGVDGAADGVGQGSELTFDVLDDRADEVVFQRSSPLPVDELGLGDRFPGYAVVVKDVDGIAPLVSEGKHGRPFGFLAKEAKGTPGTYSLGEYLRNVLMNRLVQGSSK